MEKTNFENFGKYMERMYIKHSMSGLKEFTRKFVIPAWSIVFLGGLNMIYTSKNLNWGFSNPETKNKISLFYNAKNELDSLKNYKNKLLAKCYFPFYSELGIEESQTLRGLDKKRSLLDKNKSEIKENILKNDERLCANYFGGNYYGYAMSLGAIVGFLVCLRYYYNQKKEIIKEAKEERAYWDSMSK